MKSSVKLAAMTLFLAATFPTRAALIPYFQDFESLPAGAALPGAVLGNVTATTNTWSVSIDGSSNHSYQNTLTAASGAAKGMSSIPFTNLGPASPANDFEFSAILSNVTDTAPNTVNYTAGLRFLSATAGSTNDSYVADLNFGANPGRMRIVEFTGSTTTVFPSPTQSLQPLVPNFNPANSYFMDVMGTYDASNALTLQFTVTQVGDPANTQSYTFASDTSPRTGQNFGFYDSFGAGGGTMIANYDSLTVASIPEPATMALLGLGGAFLWLPRHRNRR